MSKRTNSVELTSIPNYEDKTYVNRISKRSDIINRSIVISLVFLSISSLVFILNQTRLNLFLHTIIISFSGISMTLILISLKNIISIEFLEHERKLILSRNPNKVALLFMFLIWSVFMLILSMTPILLFVILSVLVVGLLFTFEIIDRNLRKSYSTAMIIVSVLIFSIIIITSINHWLGSLEWIWITESIILITELALTITLLVLFTNLIYYEPIEEENTISNENALREKIAEVFDEKYCEYHPIVRMDNKCPICNRDICKTCLSIYQGLCIYCYLDKLEKRKFLSSFMRYIGSLVFLLSLVLWIWGNYAPLPVLRRGLSWLGLYYSRPTILFYYLVVLSAIITLLVGGGFLLLRQIEPRIQRLYQEISEVKGSLQ
ncbi:MAG: hypothetical protein AM326_00090 [Candidatus Thorarchaeota archaeon SMTZ-45]|nr:MAG: hypothetical protein AM326_00090 [Candidatus Thorarchaeota archaeon SMTZ-45]